MSSSSNGSDARPVDSDGTVIGVFGPRSDYNESLRKTPNVFQMIDVPSSISVDFSR